MTDPRPEMQAALKQAMLAKDVLRRDVLRVALSVFKQAEIDERREITGEEAAAILQKEVKKRRDSISEAQGAGRDDIAEQEITELAILEVFLPQQLTRQEIEAVVRDVIAQTGATSPKDMGKVMGALMPRVKGLADGKLVNDVVRDLLADA